MSQNSQKVSCTSVLQTSLLVILLILSAVQSVFLYHLSQGKTTQEILLEHEYAKVGGKENYEVMTKLQTLFLSHQDNPNNIAAQKELIKQLENGTLDTTQTDNGATDAGTQPSVSTLDEASRAALMENAVVEGNANADIVMIEYSDLECPFCIMQHNDHTILEQARAEFGDSLAYVFKNHRGVNHAGTEVKALGVLCANKLGGQESYSAFYNEIFANSTSRGDFYPVADLPALAEKIGLDKQAWQSCVDGKEFLAQFEKETAEAQKYGLRGTPGTLIFNAKNGKYTTIVGAQPYANFSRAIQSLLAE